MKEKGSMNVALSDMVDTVMKLDRENARLREELHKAQKALSLANLMILSGEQHSETSEKMISEALKEGGE